MGKQQVDPDFAQPNWFKRQKLFNYLRDLSWLIISIGAAFLAIGLLAVAGVELSLPGFLGTIYQELGTDFASIGITVLIIDTASRLREIQRQKQEMIRRMRSTVRDEALRSVEALAEAGWLYDGSLNRVSLRRANLQGARFVHAVLRGADVESARFSESLFEETDLRKANLRSIRFERCAIERVLFNDAECDWIRFNNASISHVDFQGLSFKNATFKESYLRHVDMRGADLTDADLTETDFEQCQFDKQTILPDGSRWSTETDLRKFTDPNHPEYHDYDALYFEFEVQDEEELPYFMKKLLRDE